MKSTVIHKEPFRGMKRTVFQRCCTLVVAILCAVSLAHGQNDRATITGTVSDPSGAVIVGAQILVTDTATGTSYSGVTNAVGIYTIPGLPVGTYMMKASHPGFEDYVRMDIILIAAQVQQLNVRMAVGSAQQTVTVSGGVPLLETQTSTVSMTMEQSALRDLPLDATNGRDAMNLMLQTTPLVTANTGGQSNGSSGTQNWDSFAGQVTMTNSVYVDGVEATAGMQGQIATPGLDDLSEVQLITNPNDAEFGTAGGVEMFQIKSGTNQFHGSAFEFLQNEDLNANTWANNYWQALCAPSDSSCRAGYSRSFDRFNDYGASAGGPIWRNHSFIFGGFELYNYKNYQLNPGGATVPTPQMLTGDFSQLLTGGAQQGDVPSPNGGPWINPCTGQPYQYGQIFDPLTQRTVNGATCATPFSGNVIPQGRLSTVSQQIAKLYSKYYPPSISTRIYNNFNTLMQGEPSLTKFTLDLKYDQTFSPRHHLSAGLDHVSWNSIVAENSGINYPLAAGPLNNDDRDFYPNVTYRIVDTYSFTPTFLNTIGLGFNEDRSVVTPLHPVNPTTYGLSGPTTSYFPRIVYDEQASVQANGVPESDIGTDYEGYYNTNSYQYQDTAQWTKGRHNIKFGGTIKLQEENSAWGANIQALDFDDDTGGPTDPGLIPYVGNAFANQMLGNVSNASVIVLNNAYPRQKEYALFFQDDYKATPKLTLNLGLRWDVNGRLRDANGKLENFDPTVQNPLWAPHGGAWVFSHNSGTSFETNEDYHQFGPRIGGAYLITDKLVGRASYGLYFVPNGILNTSFGGTGAGYPALQTEVAFPINQVTNTIPGSIAYNWDNEYPGVSVLGPQNSTNTLFQAFNIPIYTHPDMLHLGYSQNWYAGVEYAVNNSVAVDAAYVANRGYNLHNPARSIAMNAPNETTYTQLLLSGNVNNTISNAADAAKNGVPYPYPGFVGPAYAAIAPFPQLADVGTRGIMQSVGDPTYGSVEAFNSFFIEVKARNYRGLYIDFSYTLSKMTGDFVGLSGWSNDWTDPAQSQEDWLDEKHWVQGIDQRNLLKGYATYVLPFGKSREWLSGLSTPLNEVVGGWELGYEGTYGSGFPMGAITSPYQVPFYFNAPYSGNDRAWFAPGINARDIQNHFGGHLDLANVSDPSNNDFNTDLFTATTASSPFGNTPYTFNHWRWNSAPAQENMSLLKHFDVRGERTKLIIGVQFFDVFNRHYYGSPGTSMGSPNFGQITGVGGYRYGQLSGRIEW